MFCPFSGRIVLRSRKVGNVSIGILARKSISLADTENLYIERIFEENSNEKLDATSSLCFGNSMLVKLRIRPSQVSSRKLSIHTNKDIKCCANRFTRTKIKIEVSFQKLKRTRIEKIFLAMRGCKFNVWTFIRKLENWKERWKIF